MCLPECDDDGGVGLEGGAVLAGQAEVADLQNAVVAQKQVRRLDVSEMIQQNKTEIK